MIDRFLTSPVEMLGLFHVFYSLHGFPNNLTATDREQAQKYLYSFAVALNMTGMQPFYGLEDGTLLGYWHGDLNQVPILAYREPGNSGYDPSDPVLGKYFGICKDRVTGQDTNCSMTIEEPLYVSCVDGCSLIPCDGINGEDVLCQNYEIKQYSDDGGVLGYVPTTYNCIDATGDFSQVPGNVLVPSPDGVITDGTCTFEDGTPVDGTVSGDFAACGSEQECSDTYIGAYEYRNYDPRWRGWYIDSRSYQVPRFSDPYVFFTFGSVGITYTHPIFNVQDGQQVFNGVLAVDLELTDVVTFLETTLENTTYSAAIYEFDEPYSMIAVSTGTEVLTFVLKSDGTTRCTQEQIDADSNPCVQVQATIYDFEVTPADSVLRKAHEVLVEQADDELVHSVREDDGDAASTSYLVTAMLYERPGQNIKWRIVMTVPLEGDSEDYILPGEGMYTLLGIIGGLGFFLCTALFLAFYRRRNERAVQFADFQFTSAFILGAASLNLSIFAFLGSLSDTKCLTRMWVFFLLSAVMLAPLLVKAYRTYRLLGSPVAKAVAVKLSNRSAWIRTLPIIFTQIAILVAFSIYHPPVVTENIDHDSENPTKGLRCESESYTFSWTQGAYDIVLLLTGCVLAYMTRNVDPRFGDAKALFFAMYNIAFTTLMMSLIINFVEISQSARYSLQTIGIFWATVFSSAAFVLPRLTAAKNDRKLMLKRNMRMRSTLESQRKNRVNSTSQLSENENLHDSPDALKVLVCTANIGNAPPTLNSMKAWIPEQGSCSGIKTLNGEKLVAETFHMIVIGMQEATWGARKQKKQEQAGEDEKSRKEEQDGDDASADAYSIDEDEISLEEAKAKEDNYLAAIEGAETVALRKMIKQILGDRYTNIAQEQRGQMRQTIWARTDVSPFIKDLKVTGANTGVGNLLANKGGIVISMNYLNTRMTFLSAHLAAHEGENYYKARCQNVYDILQASRTFKISQKMMMDVAVCSHHIFVCGDLNFRTKFDGENNNHKQNVARAKEIVKSEDWRTLYSFDELHKGIANGDLLVEFETLPCNFHPTFKVHRTEGFEYKDQRTPSYTDRILFKSAPNLSDNLQPISYEACVDFVTSDHKPVRGAFSIVPNAMIPPRLAEGMYRLTFTEIQCTDLLAADVDGTSDPYVKFIWDGIDMNEENKTSFKFWRKKPNFAKTGFKSKTLNPQWPDKTISLVTTSHDIKPDAMLYVCVYDYDFLSEDDMLGTVPLSVQQLAAMLPGETSKELVFDRSLMRYGKFGGKISFKLEVATLVG
eukprot:scaffold408_cov71-Cylindrotheca_fusiformis.AAC.5